MNTSGPYVQYAQIVKNHTANGPFLTKRPITEGLSAEKVSTSLVERNNLTMRTMMRRLVRRTICFSKKLENLEAAVALHLTYYNYCWKHKTLKTSPAHAAGLANRRFTLRQLYEEIQKCAPEMFL